MKKYPIAFVVAFALSVGFAFLYLVTQSAVSNSVSPDITYGFQAIFTLISIFLSLLGFAVFFSVFYFLAKRTKMVAVKSTVLAMLLGVLLGSAIPYIPSIVTYPAYLVLYLSIAGGSLLSGAFQYFLPALTALLFVELREAKLKHNLTDENEAQSTISISA